MKPATILLCLATTFLKVQTATISNRKSFLSTRMYHQRINIHNAKSFDPSDFEMISTNLKLRLIRSKTLVSLVNFVWNSSIVHISNLSNCVWIPPSLWLAERSKSLECRVEVKVVCEFTITGHAQDWILYSFSPVSKSLTRFYENIQ
jgi:hypothetical protein